MGKKQAANGALVRARGMQTARAAGRNTAAAGPAGASASAIAAAGSAPASKIKVLDTRRGAGLKELVSKISKAYGVKVAAEPKTVANPYLMSPDEAVAVARRAGIITKSGKLAGIFK
ncbi:hypothetical protein D3872_12565 [Massilia cavernae]|uniref:Uncharacterized protein n=2 Tax=Massilia cavernae TaxID=2320864 RepID=A0A418XT38_9BURK|nr:hypothetical protein D3872_12565 [Massilia cavernae]